jgi:hypothetical protein
MTLPLEMRPVFVHPYYDNYKMIFNCFDVGRCEGGTGTPCWS